MKTRVIFLVLVLAFVFSCAGTRCIPLLAPEKTDQTQKIFLMEKRNFLGITTGFIMVVVGDDGIPRAVDSNQILQGTYTSIETDSVRINKGTYPAWGGNSYFGGPYVAPFPGTHRPEHYRIIE